MPMLSDLRSLLRRRKSPTALDLTGTQAEGLGDDLAGDRPGPPARMIMESKPPRVRPSDHAAQDEVRGLIRRIGDHLDSQSARTKQLVELLERLPQAIDTVPEINRQSSRLLDVLSDHLAQARHREEALNATLSRITDTSAQQTEVMGLIQQQFDTSNQKTGELRETMECFRQTLRDLTESNARSIDVVTDLSRTNEQHETLLVEMLGRSQKWSMASLVLCAAAAIVAVMMATVAFLKT